MIDNRQRTRYLGLLNNHTHETSGVRQATTFVAGWPHRNAQCRMALADLAERFYLQNDLSPDSVERYELERNRIIRKHELTDQ